MWSKGDTRYLKIFFRQHFHPLLKGDHSHQPKPPARLHHLLGQVRLGLQPPNQTSNFGQIFLLSSFFAMRTGSLMACSAFSGSSMCTLCTYSNPSSFCYVVTFFQPFLLVILSFWTYRSANVTHLHMREPCMQHHD